jgi:hypothetical protein
MISDACTLNADTWREVTTVNECTFLLQLNV